MVLRFCQGGLGAGAVTWCGHTSLAFTQVVQNAKIGVWVSYVTKAGGGTAGYPEFVLDHFSKGSWGKAHYRVQLPTREDGCGSLLEERYAYNWFIKKKRNFKDCVHCTKQILVKAGTPQYYTKSTGTLTPSGFAGLAGDIQRKMLKSLTGLAGRARPSNSVAKDNLKGKTVIPWGYGGGLQVNKSGRKALPQTKPPTPLAISSVQAEKVEAPRKFWGHILDLDGKGDVKSLAD